jgi:hypothetical protein
MLGTLVFPVLKVAVTCSLVAVPTLKLNSLPV